MRVNTLGALMAATRGLDGYLATRPWRVVFALPVACLFVGTVAGADAEPVAEKATPATARTGSFEQPSKPAPQDASTAGGTVTRAEFEQLKRQNDELQRVIEEIRKNKKTDDPDVERIKQENQKLREKINPVAIGAEGGSVQEALARKGGDIPVASKNGKLTIGGLLQCWYYSIHNDNQQYVDADTLSGVPSGYSSGETVDNDSFRVRRAQIRFTMDLHENISAQVMLDAAADIASFPSFPSNLGSGHSGENDLLINSGFRVDQDGEDFLSTPIGNVRNDAVRSGIVGTGRLLQDAYVNIHGWIPHHDLSIGQMKPKMGEEGYREDAELDFVERSMVAQPATMRDIGMQLHGSWWDGRVQYWAGLFNGAGTAFQRRYNRADDNDEKDVLLALSLRPVWSPDRWGRLELGYSWSYGYSGEAGGGWWICRRFSTVCNVHTHSIRCNTVICITGREGICAAGGCAARSGKYGIVLRRVRWRHTRISR